MIDREFLILHGVRKSGFLKTQVFFGITALTALNRNFSDVNGVPCRYKGVNGVQLEKKRSGPDISPCSSPTLSMKNALKASYSFVK